MKTRWLAAGFWAVVAILGLTSQASAQTGQLFAYDIKATSTNEPDPFPVTNVGPILGHANRSTLAYTGDFTGSTTTVGNATRGSGLPLTRWSVTFDNNTGSTQNYDLVFSFGKDNAYQALFFRQLSFGYSTFGSGQNDTIYYTLYRGDPGSGGIRIDGGDGTGTSSSGNNDGAVSLSDDAWLSTSTVPLMVTGTPNPDSVITNTVETWYLRFTIPDGGTLTISNVEITGRSVLPEPSMALLAGVPLIGAMWMLRRRKANPASESETEAAETD